MQKTAEVYCDATYMFVKTVIASPTEHALVSAPNIGESFRLLFSPHILALYRDDDGSCKLSQGFWSRFVLLTSTIPSRDPCKGSYEEFC